MRMRRLILAAASWGLASAQALLGCDGDWLRVRIKGVAGWADQFRSNQLTTCV